MATKIRLARHGRKGRPFYHVVIADSRAPRDGKFIEKVGTYDPNTNPATINLKFDRALYWLQVGAQPTDTAKRILSYKGVLLKKHLLEGVKKGAFDEAAAEVKFEAWMKEKDSKVQAKISKLAQEGDTAAKSRLEAEAKVRAAREAEIAKKRAEAEAARQAEAAEAVAEEAPAAETETAPVAEAEAAPAVEETPAAE
ncbi:MAG: 30S ribosomal protein S16 [Culturomica sp.]|jgi:small subunit ribosomal protein S16|nr:30S ribosomal protein S16 [Culturomica sp.]